jgi:hypothetical protein
MTDQTKALLDTAVAAARSVAREPSDQWRCWFWHRWTKWLLTEKGSLISTDNRRIGDYQLYERQCLRCGKAQFDKLVRNMVYKIGGR